MDPPMIHPAPSSIVDTDTGLPTAVVTWTEPTVTDNSGTFTVTSDYHSGDAFPIGTTVVTYSATDGSGNSNTMTFDITVRGNFLENKAKCKMYEKETFWYKYTYKTK